MNDTILTPARILNAAEDILRRYGPAKANVVDVARALGVSHGSVYRHFASKAALRDAVIEAWLDRITQPLAAALDDDRSPTARLRRWFDALLASKRQSAREDPQLFAAYVALTAEAPEVIRKHVNDLVGQIAQIVSDGIAKGEFAPGDPVVMARAIFDATVRFHNPIHASEWSADDNPAAFDAVWSLIMSGLVARQPDG
jgi:AcrR family transcriptional regulator